MNPTGFLRRAIRALACIVRGFGASLVGVLTLAGAVHADPCTTATWSPASLKVELQDCDAPLDYLMRHSPFTRPVWQEGNAAKDTALQPSVQFTATDNGYDLTFTYNNTTGQSRSLGEFVIDGIRFGEDVKVGDFRVVEKDDPPIQVPDDFAPGDDFSFGESIAGLDFKTGYPSNWFSPVFTISDSTYTIGISVQYPVLDYKHRVRFSLVSDHDADWFGRSWLVRIRLNPHNNGVVGSGGGSGGAQWTTEGELAPGEVATYVVSVRVIKNDPAWTQTLEPYRDYYLQEFGPVAYPFARDPRPVRGERFTRTYAVDTCCGDLGYFNNTVQYFTPFYPMVLDPTTPGVGWRAWTDNLKDTTIELGYERAIVFSPGGIFSQFTPCPDQSQFNNPFIFASTLPLVGVDEPNPGDSYLMLNEIAQSGVEFGLYWGRVQQPMESPLTLAQWNCNGLTDDDIDLNNPADLALAYNELDTALSTGATFIGLDAFTRLQPWDQLVYLQLLIARAASEGVPDCRFGVEPTRTDFLLSYAPNIQVGNRLSMNPDGSAPEWVTLCDYMLPGHEIYALVNGNPDPGEAPDDQVGGTAEHRRAEAQQFAALGLIPIITNANAVQIPGPLNDTEATPKPPVSIALAQSAPAQPPRGLPGSKRPATGIGASRSDPAKLKKGGPAFDPAYLAVRSWQTNPALPDDPEIRRYGDVNLDGHCDNDDLDLLLANPGYAPKYDLTGDGMVDAADIAIVTQWLGAY